MKIGIFDSGIGGLTVLYEALKEFPQGDYIYYADTGNVPYGNKSREEVETLVLRAGDFLYEKNIDALVVACNTATSIGIEKLRERYNIPVIGMEPAVKTALEKDKDKKILVMATELTLKEDKFKKLVHINKGDLRVEGLPMPGLVIYAEEMKFSGKEVIDYIEKSLQPYNLKEFGTLVLGCTHFLYFKDIIRKVIPENIDIIDGNLGTVRNLMSKLPGKGIKKSLEKGKGTVEFFSSGKEGKKSNFQQYLIFLEKSIKDI